MKAILRTGFSFQSGKEILCGPCEVEISDKELSENKHKFEVDSETSHDVQVDSETQEKKKKKESK